MELMIGLGILGLVVIGYFVVTYNSIVEGKNQIKRSWSDVLVYVQKKMKIIPQLEEQVKNYQGYEEGILSKIVSLRQMQVSESTSLEKLEEVEKKFKEVMSGVKLTVENYPDLKASQNYRDLMKEIVEQQENISAAITIYNRNVEHFNNTIQTMPSSIVNSLFNKESEKEFFKTNEDVSEHTGFNPKI